VGAAFVVYFSQDLMSLDTLDFWIGTFAIYVLATFQVILFGWVLGVDRGFEELSRGAEIRVPRFMRFVIKYVSPLYLLTVFAFWSYIEFAKPLITRYVSRESLMRTFGPWCYEHFFKPPAGSEISRLQQIQESLVVQMSVALIAIVVLLFVLLVAQSVRRWEKAERMQAEARP
jgi:NSS family neurotransmitter:Na+ symporter